MITKIARASLLSAFLMLFHEGLGVNEHTE